MKYGDFFVVATPIGNLGDITYRAVEILKSVDYVACEDTRVTKKLFEKYGISTKVFDYHKFNEKKCSGKILDLLSKGNSVALVSDAGTPGISDPGGILLNELLKAGIKINSIPGASAISTFLAALSRNDEFFTFGGFIPRIKSQQEKLFLKFKNINFIFYESANRLISTLKTIEEILGVDTKVAVGRELTKLYEEIKIDKVKNIIEYYENNTLKGEIIAMIYASEFADFEDSDLIGKIKLLKKEGFSDKDISKIIAGLFGTNKNKIYKMSLDVN